MITRKQRINPNATEVQVAVSYGAADIRRFVGNFMRPSLFGPPDKIMYPDEFVKDWRTYDFAEQELRYTFEVHPAIFGNYEQPWRNQLSGWAFQQCIRLGYIVASAAVEGRYYFSPKAIDMAVKL